MTIIIEGIVTSGSKRGRELGFPTFNLMADQTGLEDGIYISETTLNERKLPSVTFVGTPDTFNDPKWRVETYILDFNQDIYQAKVAVELLEKIRDNKRFPDAETLVSQMQDDVQKTRDYFANKKSD